MAIDVQKQDLTFPHRADAHGTKGKGPLATAQVRWHEQVTTSGACAPLLMKSAQTLRVHLRIELGQTSWC